MNNNTNDKQSINESSEKSSEIRKNIEALKDREERKHLVVDRLAKDFAQFNQDWDAEDIEDIAEEVSNHTVLGAQAHYFGKESARQTLFAWKNPKWWADAVGRAVISTATIGTGVYLTQRFLNTSSEGISAGTKEASFAPAHPSGPYGDTSPAVTPPHSLRRKRGDETVTNLHAS